MKRAVFEQMSPLHKIRFRAFTLLEVVVAITVFAVGMVAVIALFAPVARSVNEVSDAEAAAAVAEQLRGELSRRVLAAGSFAPVVALLKNATSTGHEVTNSDNNSGASSDPRTDARLLFASRDGTKLAAYADSVCDRSDDPPALGRGQILRTHSDSQRGSFPNNPASDAGAVVLAYTVRIRWPAFVPDNAPDQSPTGIAGGL